VRRFLSKLGPGFITGAADDDPAGIGTYAAAGASMGYAALWTAPLTLPLMAAVQYVCAKLGLVSGQGLAGLLRERTPRPVLFASVGALFVANTLNAGADIGAIADALHLLAPMPAWLTMPLIAIGIVLLQMFGSYALISRTFKWLTLTLFGYIASALLAHPHGAEVLRGTFLPTVRADREHLALLVAVLGTTISPYLFFWQASLEVEEEIVVGRVTLQQRRGATKGELAAAAVDVDFGMFFSTVIMYFSILATAATLHRAGHTHVGSAAEAAAALEPLAGGAARALLAVGLVGAGLLAVPVLTGSTAYAVAEVFGWKHSLSAPPREALPFYGVIAVSTVLGLVLDYTGVRPFDALVGSSIVNGLLAPPLLVLVMLLSNDPKVVGRNPNRRITNVLGWLTVVLMSIAAIALLVSLAAPR
jgi:NRAMP (natural resistance-associated macrophage protein)-like metal ion transporter